MDLTRKQVIDLLEKADSTVYKEPKTKLAQALEYAISSLKTDEAYQLMYEGEEVYTKADMVAMLTDMLIDVEEIASREQWCDYANDNCISRYDVEDLIQKKIKALKENTDGTISN